MCSVALSQSETDVCICEQTALSRFIMVRHDTQIAGIVISRDVNRITCLVLLLGICQLQVMWFTSL